MLTRTAAARTRLTNLWQNSNLPADACAGVSLHSHTSCSEESLKFVHKILEVLPFAARLIGHYEKRARERHGMTLDFESAHWRPPLQPLMAYELEARQIEQIGLRAMVSISDHDNIDAPMLLRTVPVARGIPVSLEWSAPYRGTEFHLGVHNLPTADGPEWMRRFAEFTANPSDEGLVAMVRELDSLDGVLLILNHPLWDLHKVGEAQHNSDLRHLLAECGSCFHAMELNGLRHARENRDVQRLARETGHLAISGGDRHGLEPNACINFTAASNFREFVEEIRVEKQSHVVFMPQYAQPWERRILESTLVAITDHADFTPGWQRWDERAFHRDREGVMRPLSELWPEGNPPKLLTFSLNVIRLGRTEALARTLSLPFAGDHNFALEAEA